jgi:hypothetical protein
MQNEKSAGFFFQAADSALLEKNGYRVCPFL